jgi:ubiquinone/menaquinone biosynthesis C-methylase UbiE
MPDGYAGPHQLYPIDLSGIIHFAQDTASVDAARQQQHYDAIAKAYAANLNYPHTRAYTEYLDSAVVSAAGDDPLGTVVEVCCGTGEGFTLLRGRFSRGIGIDISSAMLQRAGTIHAGAPVTFLQGDATQLPLNSNCADLVVMLGGIHHVNDRAALFGEIARVLKPGGRFLFREPVNDFAPWRWIRGVIYRLSPMLDHETEHPLVWEETAPVLQSAGLEMAQWQTYGFFGFCLFMNSDVLFFNRLFQYIPGIGQVSRQAARLDDWIISLPGLKHAGLQVVGVCRKIG